MATTVYAAVLHWESPDQAIRSVRSLRESRGVVVDVVVIDNASSYSNYRILASNLDGVRVVRSPRNLGYAGGMNLALELFRGESAEYVLLVTQDVVVAPTTVEELLKTMVDAPFVGIVGPVVYYLQHGHKVFSAGGYIDVNRVEVGHYLYPRAETPYEVDWVDGCCMMIRQRAVDRVGGFDEEFFMYYEENDLCQRIRRVGYRVVVSPNAKAWHEVPPAPRSFTYHYYMARNAYLYWRKNFGVPFWAVAGKQLRSLVSQYAAALICLGLPPVRRGKGVKSTSARIIDALRRTGAFFLGTLHYLRKARIRSW